MQLIVRLIAPSGGAPQLVEALHRLMRHTRRQAGCSDAHLAADVHEANTYWYSEDWKDAEAMEEALRTDRFTQLLALMETSAEPPALEFRMIAETLGLEYVAAARKSAKANED